MKRIVSILILLCFLVAAYADGEVIEIWTKKQLEEVRDAVNNKTDNFSGKTVRLMADLDIDIDSDWTPIGTIDDEAHSFKGTFDGQGNTINIFVTGNSTVLGLFGYFRGTVENLKVTGKVLNTEKVKTSSTAGIVAYNRGTISQCANMATIQGTIAGGIAGENHGTITNCYHQGNIYATSGYKGTYYLGGIAGIEKGISISNVYAFCDKMDNVSSTGGIVATNQKETLSNCFYDVTWIDSGKMEGCTTLTGNTLKGVFDNSIWTFAAGKLPELTCFVNKIVRLGDNNDNGVILTSYHEKTCTVELSGRTLYKDGAWNTLCLPFDLTLSGSVLDGDNVVAKVLDGTHTSLDDTGLLSLTFNNAPSTILAGTPFIIKWNNTGSHLTNVRFSGVTLYNTAPKPVKFSNAFGDQGEFVGTYSPFSIDAGNIDEIVLLSDANKLGYSKNPRTLRSCRAHFMIPTSSSGIRAMVDFDIDFNGGESTGVAALNDNREMIHDNDGWYTLTGVKLDGKPTRRGIYLHNGRKEAVK